MLPACVTGGVEDNSPAGESEESISDNAVSGDAYRNDFVTGKGTVDVLRLFIAWNSLLGCTYITFD